MKELQSIVDAAAEAERTGVPTLLATVVQVEGSTYRRPGAHLLVTEDGRHTGSISGGCLERDLVERARTLTRAGAPALVTYNTADDDLIFGFAAGCRGVIRILVERPGCDGRPDPVAFIRECLRRRRPGVLATVYQVEGPVGVACGERVLLAQDSDFTGDIRNAHLRSRVAGDARDALAIGRSTTTAYALTSGAARVFFDVIRPPVSLVICGAGRDALPVVRLARELGWQVTVVDWRPALATRESVPLAHEIVLSSAEALSERVRLERCDAVLVMTHNALQDRALLAQLLPSPVPYIGVLGPRTRTHELLLEIQGQGVAWTDAQLARLYAPVGLDIGAEEPETIALAILAEIQAVLAGRSGGALRHRAGPIHLESELQPTGKGRAAWAETQTARDPSPR
jgi:xanthine/CO dehydrogenase XdhC/CoxF family maturation factor